MDRIVEAILPEKDQEILAVFTPEQRFEIKRRLRVLSSLALFIGKDYTMPVELDEPGSGWSWDFKNNIIHADAKDLLEKHMDFLRFVICHEGGHRRITRADFIPLEEWRQPGFSFMMNCVEDPRDNNFVAECYYKFAQQMAVAYDRDLDIENKAKEKAVKKLGYEPRFVKAGFEYIKQWYRETQGLGTELTEGLPEDVRLAVAATLEAARDSWWRYPSRQEADESEDNIQRYARASYEINRDKIWPEFRKLVEADLQDQRLRQLLKELHQEGQKSGKDTGQKPSLPPELKDKLSPAQAKDLEKAEDLTGIPEDLKNKLKEYFDSLPEDKKKELTDKAGKSLKELEDEINVDIAGKLNEKPEDREGNKDGLVTAEKDETEDAADETKDDDEVERANREKMEALFEQEGEDAYQRTLVEVSDDIDALTADLRDIFKKRKIEKFEAGYRSGRRWNVRQRIREKIAGIPLFKTEAREQKEAESEESDYAVTLMIDLSGSMEGEKIEETFKALIIWAETLNNLGIKFEIVGFQDILLEYKAFDEALSEDIRRKISGMLLEVSNGNPGGHNQAEDNNDGPCLLTASSRLASQSERNKFLVVLSDGEPVVRGISSQKAAEDLKKAVAAISQNTRQHIIAIGLMSGAVSRFYENHLANVTASQMREALAELLREIIEIY